MAHVERDIEGLHRRDAGIATQVELQHAAVTIGCVAHTEFVGSIGNRRQTEGKVEGAHAVELVTLVVTPTIALTGKVVEAGCFTVVDDQILEETVRTADVVTTQGSVRTRLTTVEGSHFSIGNHAEIVGHHFTKERRVVEAKTLVEDTARHLAVVDQHALDGVDVAVESLDVVSLHLNTRIHHRLHVSRSLLGDAVGQRAVGSIVVDVALTIDADNLQQGVGQHGLVVFEQHHLRHFVERADQLIVRNLVFQDVVAHKHVQSIVRAGIVVASADLIALVAIKVVPAGTRLCTVGIDLIGIFCQIFH